MSHPSREVKKVTISLPVEMYDKLKADTGDGMTYGLYWRCGFSGKVQRCIEEHFENAKKKTGKKRPSS